MFVAQAVYQLPLYKEQKASLVTSWKAMSYRSS